MRKKAENVVSAFSFVVSRQNLMARSLSEINERTKTPAINCERPKKNGGEVCV